MTDSDRLKLCCVFDTVERQRMSLNTSVLLFKSLLKVVCVCSTDQTLGCAAKNTEQQLYEV